MTRKDYQIIADCFNSAFVAYNDINNYKASFIVQGIVNKLEIELAKDNPRFDKEKFRSACGI